MIITLLQILLFSFFTLYVSIKYGVQKSISESWYVMEGKFEQTMFTLVFCNGLGILMMLHGTLLFFLSGVLLCFVGVATDFKSGYRVTPSVHYIGASGSIILALIELGRQGVYWTAIPIILGIGLLRYHEQRTWWIEVNAAIWIFIGLIILKDT